MKRLKKYWLLLIAVPCLVVTCMTIEDIIHPDNALVNSDIEIIVRIKFDAATDGNSRLAFGVLAPASWNIAGSATLTLTTTADFAANVVTNEPLTVIPANETRDGKSWPDWFLDQFTDFGNTEPMEWVVFESNTTFQINDTKPEQDVVNGTVNIKLHTGDTPIKPIMGYAALGRDSGRGDDNAALSKELEVKEVLFASFGPAAFGFGDIFSVKYTELHIAPAAIALRGDNVYLLGTVTYEVDGAVNEKTVDETSDKTLMEDLGDMNQANSWEKYIYPKDFFDLPGNAVITEIVVQFANQDKSIITSDFTVEPTCQ